MTRKLVFRVLKIALLVYSLIGIAIYYLQDSIFFHPKPLEETHAFKFDQPFKELNIPYSAHSVMNVVQFAPTRTDSGKAKGVVLYFHGNKENIEHYASAAPGFTSKGYETWMIDYPGFGKSTGKFTEQTLYDWALVFYKLARAKYEPGEIITYGRSLGTGIAAQLASVRDCRYLVLETPYYSFPSLVDNYLPIYPTNRLIWLKLPTWQYLQKVTAPVMIFHGTDDWQIPIRNARRLSSFLKKGDEFVTIEGGAHNDLSTSSIFQSKIDSLLAKPVVY